MTDLKITPSVWQAYAKFSNSGNYTFRTNTIISNTNNPITRSHNHLFSVIMFNPGSSSPAELTNNEMISPCSLDSTMRRIIQWTEIAAINKTIPIDSFITIYNLYNIVTPDINKALDQITMNSDLLIKEEIDLNYHQRPKFIWKAWGISELEVVKNRIKDIELIISNNKIPVIGDHHPSLKNYHPSYLNRDKIRRSLIIDEISKYL
jgi:hypothetical protein